MKYRKSSFFLLGLVASLALLIGALVWSLLWRQELAEGSSNFTLDLLEQTLVSGQAAALVNNAHPELLAEVSAANLQNYMTLITTRLGPLQTIRSIRSDKDLPLLPLLADVIEMHYSVDLEFARGEAVGLIVLKQPDSGWQVSRFTVDSPLLYD